MAKKIFEVDGCVEVYDDGKISFSTIDQFVDQKRFNDNQAYADYINQCFGGDNQCSFDPTGGTGTIVINNPTKKLLFGGIKGLIDECGAMYSTYDPLKVYEQKSLMCIESAINKIIANDETGAKNDIREFIEIKFMEYVNGVRV